MIYGILQNFTHKSNFLNRFAGAFIAFLIFNISLRSRKTGASQTIAGEFDRPSARVLSAFHSRLSRSFHLEVEIKKVYNAIKTFSLL